MSRELPILMSGEFVRATLDGRKTVTRRPAKIPERTASIVVHPTGDRVECLAKFGAYRGAVNSPCQAGDLLYVREAWAPSSWVLGTDTGGIVYRATERRQVARWHPSIHMPKHFARLWLDVVSVRVELAQDITEDDAKREGLGGREEFITAWAALYGGASWDANPWVWRIEYRVNEERTGR